MWLHEYIFLFILGVYFWKKGTETKNIVYPLASITIFFIVGVLLLFGETQTKIIYYALVDNNGTEHWFGSWSISSNINFEWYTYLVYFTPCLFFILFNLVLLIEIIYEMMTRGRL